MTTGEKLKSQLTELSRNLWWAWNPHIIKLFRDLDAEAFRAANHNPVSVLAGFSPERFDDLARDAALRARVDSAFRELRDYLGAARTWGSVHAGPLRVRPVAYFSAEFGIHESLPIYSGGLGVLAGDHLKSASDLGLPLVAVGLFYRESYFRQRIDRDGWQHAEYVRSPAELLPAKPAADPGGRADRRRGPAVAARRCARRCGRSRVGRNKLLLLDTDVDGNSEENRQLAARLYFGDQRIRIRQELLLGVGGVRALRAAGIHWGGLHLNEGHSAFATLEYTRLLHGADRRRLPDVRAGGRPEHGVHHPHAGRRRPRSLPARAGRRAPGAAAPLARAWRSTSSWGSGRIRPEDHREALCMTVLAFKMSRYANGVSALHGRITRKSWQVLWPHHREDEVPVGHITNGVHVRTWLAPAMQELYAKHMGADWRDHLADPRMWARIDSVPDAELWETHRVLKAAWCASCAGEVARAAPPQRLPRGAGGGGRGRARSRRADHRLRAPLRHLQARQPDLPRHGPPQAADHRTRRGRCSSCSRARPTRPTVPGRRCCARCTRPRSTPSCKNRVVFIEDYDINVGPPPGAGRGRLAEQPAPARRRPAAPAARRCCSTAASTSRCSTAGGPRPTTASTASPSATAPPTSTSRSRTGATPSSLYDTLENEVVPLYYERDDHGVPRGWVARMKRTHPHAGLALQHRPHGDGLRDSATCRRPGAKSSHMR